METHLKSSFANGAARYADTIDYLNSNGFAELATSIDQDRQSTAEEIGRDLTLSKSGSTTYAKTGDREVGRAVRALLLCQRVYLCKDWGRGVGGEYGVPTDLRTTNSARVTKQAYLHRSKGDVDDAIRSYVTEPATLSGLIDVAKTLKSGVPGYNVSYETLTRDDIQFPHMGVCFNACVWWLFKAGYVSLRWVARNGGSLIAQNANRLLGKGTTIDQQNGLNGIAPGYMVNWRGRHETMKGVCHWAVSLGNGRAVGVNNSGGGRDAKGQAFLTDFEAYDGAATGSPWGIFDVAQMCAIYSDKAVPSDRVLQIDRDNAAKGLLKKQIDPNKGYGKVACVDPAAVPDRNTGTR